MPCRRGVPGAFSLGRGPPTSRGLTAQGSLYCGCSAHKCPVTGHIPALGKWEGLLGAGLRPPWTLCTEGPEPEQATSALGPAGGLYGAWGWWVQGQTEAPQGAQTIREPVGQGWGGEAPQNRKHPAGAVNSQGGQEREQGVPGLPKSVARGPGSLGLDVCWGVMLIILVFRDYKMNTFQKRNLRNLGREEPPQGCLRRGRREAAGGMAWTGDTAALGAPVPLLSKSLGLRHPAFY